MHTSSGVNAVSQYLETVEKKGDRFYYKYGNEERPLATEEITVRYKTGDGMAERNSPSTAPITDRLSVRRTASGSASG